MNRGRWNIAHDVLVETPKMEMKKLSEVLAMLGAGVSKSLTAGKINVPEVRYLTMSAEHFSS